MESKWGMVSAQDTVGYRPIVKVSCSVLVYGFIRAEVQKQFPLFKMGKLMTFRLLTFLRIGTVGRGDNKRPHQNACSTLWFVTDSTCRASDKC